MRAVCLVILLFVSVTRAGWTMVWNDEFDGPELNTSKWQREVNCWGGGNNEAQCYTARPQNVYLENGALVLRAIQETYTGTQADCTDPQGCVETRGYTSGRVRTMMDPDGSWTGGRFEIRAQLPDGAYLWPAIWMLPRHSTYGGWAASGEIDIMEAKGQHVHTFNHAMHYGGAWPANRFIYYQANNYTQDLSTTWNTFGLEWEPAKDMRFYFNDELSWRVDLKKWWWDASQGIANPYTAEGQPWDKPFFMILNLAIGGGFFNGYPPMPDNQGSQWRDPTLKVDFVRVYKHTDDEVPPENEQPSPSQAAGTGRPAPPETEPTPAANATAATDTPPATEPAPSAPATTGSVVVDSLPADGNATEPIEGEEAEQQAAAPAKPPKPATRSHTALIAALTCVGVGIAVLGTVLFFVRRRLLKRQILAADAAAPPVELVPGDA